MAFILNTTNQPTVDESSSLQNLAVTPSVASDANDTDISVASINGSDDTGDLPYAFESRLFTLFGSPSTPIAPLQVALSGYTGSGTGGDLITITNTYIDLSFTDAQGKALGDPTNLNGGSDWSGLYTIDGTKIFLYTDSVNNNIVLGRVGNAQGTPNDPSDDTANSSGTIVFAAYLDETQTATGGSAKVWMTLFQPLQHPNTTDPDDAVDMTNHLWVGATQDLGFDFSGVPSGQNLFLMFANATQNVGIVVTGKDPADQSAGESVTTGDTVNTSKGGGATTIGSNNQMLDPPSSQVPAAEGLNFMFVTDPVSNYTVPNLTHGEAVVEDNIDFGGLYSATGATFSIVQLQPPKMATLKITAYKEVGALEEKSDYVNGLADDVTVNIDGVKIFDQNKVEITDLAAAGITLDFTGGDSVVIAGVKAGYSVKYHTGDGTNEFLHNRVLIENVGNATDANYNASFDIGGFFLPNLVVSPQEIGSLLNFEDDAPKILGSDTRTVDEDGLTGGIAGALIGGDVVVDNNDGDNNEATTAGVLTSIFSAGNDGLASFGLDDSSISLVKAYAAEDLVNPLALTSKGGTVLYDVVGSTLWGFVNVDGVATEYDGTDRAVFKLELSNLTTTGDYKFTLLDQLDHPTLNGVTGDDTENDIVLNLGSVLKVTDKDGDSRLGSSNSLAVTVDDDSPVVLAKSNLVYANETNPTPGGTGIFAYAIGADERTGTTYSSSNTDLLVSLTGVSVGSNAITNKSASWASETATQAVFNFSFTYLSDPVNSTSSNASGTLTFDKAGGTYTVALSQPVASYSVLSTATAQGFTGYLPNSSTTDSTQPEVTVATLASNFFVQFTGYAEPGSGTGDKNLNAGVPGVDGGSADDSFSDGDLFSQATSWASVSGTAAGVAGDTMQQGEVLDLDFFKTNPTGFSALAPTATSSAMFLQFDGLDNNEDLVVVLKLVDTVTHLTTTRAVIADYADIFHKADQASIPAAFGFTGTLDNNDGLVVIENQDFNFAGEHWVIQGAQVLASTEGVSGKGINLNGAIGAGGGSAGSLQSFADATDTANTLPNTLNGSPEAGTWDGDVFKIVNIGFVTDVNQDAHLTFNVAAQDFDGDKTSSQTLDVSIKSDGSLSPTSGVDTFVFSDADTDGLLAAVMYNITSGFVSGTDRLDFAVAGSVANYAENTTPASNLSAFVTAADTALTATVNYYFGVVGGDGYLATDTDGLGITSIIKLAGVTDMAFGDII